MRASDHIIAEAVRKAQDSTAVVRFADVVAVAGRTITVDLGGVNVPDIPCLGSYTNPTVGQRAWLLMQGSTLTAMGSNDLTDIGTTPVYAYVHNQTGVASTWTIYHGLGWHPSVQVYDSGGTQIEGSVVHLSANELTVAFTAAGSPVAFSGTAYLS